MRISKLAQRTSILPKRLARFPRHFTTVRGRIAKLGKRLPIVPKRLVKLGKRLTTVRGRTAKLGGRFTTVGGRIAGPRAGAPAGSDQKPSSIVDLGATRVDAAGAVPTSALDGRFFTTGEVDESEGGATAGRGAIAIPRSS
jgi:hypothetical protein